MNINVESCKQKTVYNWFVESAMRGLPFKVDLIKKDLTICNDKLIYHGDNYTDIKQLVAIPLTDPWAIVDKLYHEYKYSTPEKTGLSKSSWFYALPYEDMSDVELVIGGSRSIAQAKLEGYILCASLSGILKWEDDNKWFQMSEKDNDFVIIKNWIVK